MWLGGCKWLEGAGAVKVPLRMRLVILESLRFAVFWGVADVSYIAQLEPEKYAVPGASYHPRCWAQHLAKGELGHRVVGSLGQFEGREYTTVMTMSATQDPSTSGSATREK